jgi:CO/xanthine dehydrogenase Mo-binding subunit
MCISAWGCYRIPHFRVRARTVYTNKVPAASFRATGKTQTTFAVESLMDSVAGQLGLSPVAFRVKNALGRGERIAERWRVQGKEYAADIPPMDMDFPDMMRRAMDAIGWDGTPARGNHGSQPGAAVARGRGMAFSLRHGAQGGGRAYAMATIDDTGRVTIAHAAPDVGEGAYQMIAVVAARTLGIPESQVAVGVPDTSQGLNFEGSSAQRTTVQMGNAVRAACESLRQELQQAAAQAIGGQAGDWRVAGGRVSRGEQSFSLAEIVRAFAAAPSFEGHVELKGLGSYSYAPSEDKAFGGLDHWAPGVIAVEVEVDLESGEIAVLQMAAVADAGKVLHAASARGQLEGGAVMGLGLALGEELIYGGDGLLNGDAFQYRLPKFRDVPAAFFSSIVENGDGPGPFGSKGMAQVSIPCVPPAINNAVRDAIGVHLHSAPFTPEKVLRALGQLDPEHRAGGGDA